MIIEMIKKAGVQDKNLKVKRKNTDRPPSIVFQSKSNNNFETSKFTDKFDEYKQIKLKQCGTNKSVL